MNLLVTAFTGKGVALARFLCQRLEGTLCLPRRLANQEMGDLPYDKVDHFAQLGFSAFEGLLFVGACGIGVRAIAPYVKDKLTDPAVVSVDEQGRFVVPLLSGHVGGGNQLARQVADITQGTAVISTATDVNDKFAVDVWAKENGLTIPDRRIAKEISAAILEGNTVGFATKLPYAGDLPAGVELGDHKLGFSVSLNGEAPFDQTLTLVPKILTLGIGCRKQMAQEVIEKKVAEVLEANHLSIEAVSRVCSIDLKAEEPGLLAFCHHHKLPFTCYTAEELSRVPGNFTPSAFVQSVTGVDNVCERSAIRGGGKLIVRKQAGEGVTVAVAQRPYLLRF